MEKMLKMIDYIISYSCNINPNDVVYINFYGEPNEFLRCMLYKLKRLVNEVILNLDSNVKVNSILKGITIQKASNMASVDVCNIKRSTVYISLVAEEIQIDKNLENEYNIYHKHYKQPVREARLKHCRWLGLKLPTKEMARAAHMNASELEKIYYEACSVDYAELENQNLWLVNMIEQTNKIRILTPTTDVSFTKEGIGARILCGKINMPDGEIYTAPNKESVNGTIKFNTTSLQAGFRFQDIALVFEDGRVISAQSNDTDKLNSILNLDEGARFVGEFAVGINETIKKPIGIILFDEKIKGTVHFALGQSYKDAYNYNDSSLHWDLVLNMNKNFGGGTIFFDDKPVFKNGIWLKATEQ